MFYVSMSLKQSYNEYKRDNFAIKLKNTLVYFVLFSNMQLLKMCFENKMKECVY